jgi:hypothetical protein
VVSRSAQILRGGTSKAFSLQRMRRKRLLLPLPPGSRRPRQVPRTALATEEPLLLASDHGAARTLLVRLAKALGLTLRHYNASILQLDEIIGFPIPDDAGAIRHAAPAGAIWGAEVAFFDEIDR